MPTVQDYLGVPADWKVKENIKHSLVIMPSKADIRKAEPRNPTACALHNAACRQFEIPNCAIGKRFAYIPQRDAKGKWYIARMKPTDQTIRAITQFDKTGAMPVGGFEFTPVPSSQTLKAARSYASRGARSKADGTKKQPKTLGNRLLKSKRNVPLRAMPRSLRDG